MLIIFGGPPGVGKTAVASKLAAEIGAVYLRIDSIEQALRDSGSVNQPLNDAGYRVAYALAEENLRLGRTVVADSVNPLSLTRDAWLEVAKKVGVAAIEVEVKCSDVNEHQRRVEQRATHISGLRPPTWEEVVSREYHPWTREHVVLDTAASSLEQNVSTLRTILRKR